MRRGCRQGKIREDIPKPLKAPPVRAALFLMEEFDVVFEVAVVFGLLDVGAYEIYPPWIQGVASGMTGVPHSSTMRKVIAL